METYINFFKIADDEDPLGVRIKSLVTLWKPVKLMINVRNARKVTMNVKSGYVVLYIISDTIKKVFMEYLFHAVILLDYINRFY